MTHGRSAENGGPSDGAARPTPEAEPPAGPSSPNGSHPAAAGPIRRTVRIVNPLGLHHRVADLFHRVAKRYVATITVRNGDLHADGKSVWDLIGLLAFEGTDIVLEIDGPDALLAVEPLVGILAAPSGEDYTDDSIGSGI